MSNAESKLRGVDDPLLAAHATSNHPVWLWSLDGTRVLWANPVAAKLSGARNSADLAGTSFGPADPHRRQLAQLGPKLPASGAVRLERLRGFGAAAGGLMTCACSRLAFPDGGAGLLIVAIAFAGRVMPLLERLQNLVDGTDLPIAAFARDGVLVGASNAGRTLLGFRSLSEAGLETARTQALKDGRVEAPILFGHIVLQRVGSGADVGLVAMIAPGAAQTDTVHPAEAGVETEPADAVATFAHEFAEPADVARVAAGVTEPADQPVAEVDPGLVDAVPPAVAPEHHDAPDPAAAPKSQPEAEASAHETAALLESVIAITIAEAAPQDADPHEPSPYVEAVADEPVLQAAPVDPLPPDAATPGLPLRFLWQMDAEQRFCLGSDEFTKLIGARTAAGFGRPWREIAETFGLDPDGHVLKAVATRNTWSGITLLWPVDGAARLPVELSGLPVYDRAGQFAGFRGFGVCRDFAAMAHLAALRRQQFVGDPPLRALSADIAQAGPVGDDLDALIAPMPASTETLPTEPDTAVETPKNVVPFRPGDLKSPVLSPVENSAFNELARQLSARLDAETELTSEPQPGPLESEEMLAQLEAAESPNTASEQPDWLAPLPPPARGELARDRVLLDLLPVGVLIYRLDRLLYANPSFLTRIGYATLQALEDAGGLDALFVEPDVGAASSASASGTKVTISAAAPGSGVHTQATDARLFSIAWDGEQALALIFDNAGAEPRVAPAPVVASIPPVDMDGPHADAEELAAILDTTAEGIVMFDADGRITSCNRSAEALFGYDGDALTRKNLVDLFAQESRRVVLDYLASLTGSGVASLLDHGREALGQVRAGGLIPLSVMIGRTREGGTNFFAVFRDLTQIKKTETELLNARRQADRAATAKSDLLARLSHEVRTPLNAIIGFAEVMTDARFGPLGNERYVEYMKDIRASGERVIAIINDLLDLSRIETGKLDLSFSNQNLNEMVEQCVAVMQPQANRSRIIIRTSLAHMLPRVVADARALRQIALNLIGNSIHLANAGGQVIVSTALTDFGEVVLRVRDTGHGLNDHELAAAMEPFSSQAPADYATDSSGVSLSLTKALVEANRARFQIKTAPSSGTLIEVVFSNADVKAAGG
jgi:PAS domain S-box-containing protein